MHAIEAKSFSGYGGLQQTKFPSPEIANMTWRSAMGAAIRERNQ